MPQQQRTGDVDFGLFVDDLSVDRGQTQPCLPRDIPDADRWVVPVLEVSVR